MAIWNNQTRGNVIAIQTGGNYDPTDIIKDSYPMPTADNPNGFGNFQAVTRDKIDQFQPPEMDPVEIPGASPGGGNPYPGME